MAIWVPYEEVLKQLLKRQADYEPRILADVEKGITEADLVKPKKANGEKPKKIRQRKKKKKQTRETYAEPEQDDRFFFIAGYTSGGAPYGVTWEEMGLQPWQSLEDSDDTDE